MDHDGENSTVAYASLIQTFNRYLLEQMTAESHVTDTDPVLIKGRSAEGKTEPPLSQLIRLNATTVSTCQQCGAASKRDTSVSVVDMIYPRRVCDGSSLQAFLPDAFITRSRLCRMKSRQPLTFPQSCATRSTERRSRGWSVPLVGKRTIYGSRGSWVMPLCHLFS